MHNKITESLSKTSNLHCANTTSKATYVLNPTVRDWSAHLQGVPDHSRYSLTSAFLEKRSFDLVSHVAAVSVRQYRLLNVLLLSLTCTGRVGQLIVGSEGHQLGQSSKLFNPACGEMLCSCISPVFRVLTRTVRIANPLMEDVHGENFVANIAIRL